VLRAAPLSSWGNPSSIIGAFDRSMLHEKSRYKIRVLCRRAGIAVTIGLMLRSSLPMAEARGHLRPAATAQAPGFRKEPRRS
jgi:hypothetical protein